MENRHTHHSGFFNGLVIGMIIGAALVFFLGTKKGRELFQTLKEEGFEEFGSLKELFNDEVEEAEEEEAMETAKEEQPHKIKRFFRRIKKTS
ncbi:MAG TPA: hypothetical protein VGT05_02440 [Patescibacteria group bacterium]|nr:hypothetical protein [Patescibacteria group bacterium]